MKQRFFLGIKNQPTNKKQNKGEKKKTTTANGKKSKKKKSQDKRSPYAKVTIYTVGEHMHTHTFVCLHL